MTRGAIDQESPAGGRLATARSKRFAALTYLWAQSEL
jgi:hypothetical protein